jgi:phage terminase large subunit-like protein
VKDYASIATQYARDVVGGDVLACKWVRLACRRHLRDLERDASGWRFRWNPELKTVDELDDDGRILREGKPYHPADRVCHFIELLPHIKGDWAARRERIRLEPWEVFFIASVFGWIDRDTNRRRFRIADLFVPRKNAKSTIAAAIGLYLLACDGEFGAEIYSGATSEGQAREVFDPARLMAEQSPDFRSLFGVLVRASAITIPSKNCKFEPIIGKPGDGASPSCAIIDEFHEHPTEDLYDTMRTGMGARAQALTLVITTSGDDIAGPCYAHQEELQQILEGVIEDEQRFGVIYTLDVDDEGKLEDWTTVDALVKANPNFNVSVDAEFLLSQQRDAVRDSRKQATFQTKHLNIWVQSSSPWLNLHDWKSLADKTLKIEDFIGGDCVEGLDLANVTDIASNCQMFQREIDDGTHYYAFWRHYLPEAVIHEPDNKHYQGWKRDGWLIESSGNMIDQDQIKRDILGYRNETTDSHVPGDRDRFKLKEVAIDNWGSPGIAAALANSDVTVVRIPQNVSHLSAPMKFIDGLVKSGRLHHNGDPVATWGVSNVQVKPDHNENWFPRRGTRKKKIDPALALIMAMARALVDENKPSVYSTRGILRA